MKVTIEWETTDEYEALSEGMKSQARDICDDMESFIYNGYTNSEVVLPTLSVRVQSGIYRYTTGPDV